MQVGPTFRVIHKRSMDVEVNLVLIAVGGECVPVAFGALLVLVTAQKDWPFESSQHGRPSTG